MLLREAWGVCEVQAVLVPVCNRNVCRKAWPGHEGSTQPSATPRPIKSPHLLDLICCCSELGISLV